VFHITTLIIHNLFNLDYTAPERNKMMSYLDMPWLYGMKERREKREIVIKEEDNFFLLFYK
jgi:hypothetical protein